MLHNEQYLGYLHKLQSLLLRSRACPQRPERSDGLISRLLPELGIIVKVHSLSIVPAKLIHGCLAFSCPLKPVPARLRSFGRELVGGASLEGLSGDRPGRQFKLFLQDEFVVKGHLDSRSNVELILRCPLSDSTVSHSNSLPCIRASSNRQSPDLHTFCRVCMRYHVPTLVLLGHAKNTRQAQVL